jgi:FixJ family two-component response regulator
MSELQFKSELASNGTPIPVIFITAYGDIPMTVRAMRSGAIEFLPKPFRDRDLLDAVQIALEKDRSRRRRDAEMSVLRDRFKSLTRREQELLRLVVSGLVNKQITALIEVSEATVKVHRSQLTRKMGARSLPELVRIAEKICLPSTDPRGM